jgi:hypothetical protein
MSKLNWDRCKRQGRATEAKYSPGYVLPNGVVTTGPRKDDLAYRADRAMRAWQRKLSPEDRRRVKWAASE